MKKISISQFLSDEKGFSLIEVIIAIFVITVGIIGVTALINSSLSDVSASRSQIIASSLAQEGLEVVRNIRDTNWLQGSNWNNGLGSGDWRAQYDDSSLLALLGNPVLKIDGNGIYQYDSGTDTLFHRQITITNLSAYQMKVVVNVTWQEKGKSYAISAENRLYDWR